MSRELEDNCWATKLESLQLESLKSLSVFSLILRGLRTLEERQMDHLGRASWLLGWSLCGRGVRLRGNFRLWGVINNFLLWSYRFFVCKPMTGCIFLLESNKVIREMDMNSNHLLVMQGQVMEKLVQEKRHRYGSQGGRQLLRHISILMPVRSPPSFFRAGMSEGTPSTLSSDGSFIYEDALEIQPQIQPT